MRTLVAPLELATIRELVRPAEPVASVYLGLAPAYPTLDAQEDLDLRWRGVADRLAAEGADPLTLGALAGPMTGLIPGPGELAAFARRGRLLLCQPTPGVLPFDRARYGAPADVVPLLAWLARHPAYVAVVADRTGADITVVRRGAAAGPTSVVVGPDDEIERNAPGGWSQPRFQHRAEDSWRHNAGAVAGAVVAALRDSDARLLLIGGDVRAVQLVYDHLPSAVHRTVTLRHLPGGRAPDGSGEARQAAVALAVEEYAAHRADAALAALDRHGGPRGTAVQGVAATVAALAARRVQTLFVTDDPDDARTAWFDADTPCTVTPRRGERLVCGRLVDVAVRAALLAGGEIQIVRPGVLTEDVGALCRFPTAG